MSCYPVSAAFRLSCVRQNEASTGAVTALWLKSPEDPMWDADDGMKEYRAFLKDWAPNEEVEDAVFPEYSTAQIIVEILEELR